MKDPARVDSTLISVVAPLYNEQDTVPVFVEKLSQVFRRIGYRWELVLALDPSTDMTRHVVLELIEKGYPIRLVTFSRRIGKPLSVLAGLDYTMGDACVVMDVDLQDPPELIEQMVEKWREGFKVVIAQRTSRKGEHPLYLKAAELYYGLLDRLSQVKIPPNAGDYRLLDARVVSEIRRCKEHHGFLRGITAAVGFSTALVPFVRDARFSGKTRISLRGALNIALDGIVPFSRVPVRLVFVLGLVLSILGVTGSLMLLGAAIMGKSPDQWAAVMACILSFLLSGLTMTCLGIVGEYVLRIYEETRHRTRYIVEHMNESKTLPRKLQRPQDGPGHQVQGSPQTSP